MVDQGARLVLGQLLAEQRHEWADDRHHHVAVVVERVADAMVDDRVGRHAARLCNGQDHGVRVVGEHHQHEGHSGGHENRHLRQKSSPTTRDHAGPRPDSPQPWITPPRDSSRVLARQTPDEPRCAEVTDQHERDHHEPETPQVQQHGKTRNASRESRVAQQRNAGQKRRPRQARQGVEDRVARAEKDDRPAEQRGTRNTVDVNRIDHAAPGQSLTTRSHPRAETQHRPTRKRTVSEYQ